MPRLCIALTRAAEINMFGCMLFCQKSMPYRQRIVVLWQNLDRL